MIQGSQGPSMDGKEHRRSPRFEVVVPIEVSWAAATGIKVIEPAEVVEASQHGGLLAMHKYPPLGIEIEVTNNLTGEKACARSIAIRHSKEANAIVAIRATLRIEHLSSENSVHRRRRRPTRLEQQGDSC